MAVTASSSGSASVTPQALARRWGRELTDLTSGQRWTLGACAVATALFLAAGLPGARTIDDAGISGSLEPVGAAAVDVTPAPGPAPAPVLAPPPAAPVPVPVPTPEPAPPAPADLGPSGGRPAEPTEPSEPAQPDPLSVLPIPLPLP